MLNPLNHERVESFRRAPKITISARNHKSLSLHDTEVLEGDRHNLGEAVALSQLAQALGITSEMVQRLWDQVPSVSPQSGSLTIWDKERWRRLAMLIFPGKEVQILNNHGMFDFYVRYKIGRDGEIVDNFPNE